MASNFKPFAFEGIVGKTLVRRTGREKVTGTATFTAEWPLDGLLHAVAVPSNIPRGRVRSIDTSDAKKMPGVRLVLTAENLPKFTRVKTAQESEFQTCLSSSVYPIADQEVWFCGQYLAAVVADTFETARDAAMSIRIDYEPENHTTNIDDAPADERPSSIMGAPAVITIGDAQSALDSADVSIDSEFPSMGNHHNPIEMHATIAEWSEKDGKPFLTVYETSQSLVSEQKTYAQLFGLKPDQVRVVCRYVGGAFGSKGVMWPQALLACWCAKLTGSPVKIVVSRQQMYGGTGFRTPMRQRVALGASKDGTLTSIIHEGVASTSRNDEYVEAFTMATRMMYRTPALRLAQRQCRLDTQIPTFMRAPAETPGMYALEIAVDELAAKLEMDPIALRIRNEPEKDNVQDNPFSGRHLVTCLRAGAEAFGWDARPQRPRERREGDWLIGIGVAAATYPVVTFPTAARVTLRANGTAHIDCCSQELGTGTITTQCQLLADMLGIPASRVSMTLGDTDLPPGGVSGGSSTALSVGAAIRDALQMIKQQLIDLAPSDSEFASAESKELQFRDGKLTLNGGDGVGFDELLSSAMRDKVAAVGNFSRDGESSSSTSNHSFGAQFIEVAVDEELGLVRVRRMLGCFACGTILNAKTARSQFLGGMVMGVGHALQEATHWDHRLGRITNDNLAEYHVPVNADIPNVDVMIYDEPDFNASPIGAKGIGEIGITGVAAAVSNAIYNATGRRFRALPITPEHVMSRGYDV